MSKHLYSRPRLISGALFVWPRIKQSWHQLIERLVPKNPAGEGAGRPLAYRLLYHYRWPLGIFAGLVIAGITTFIYFYLHYAALIDKKLGDTNIPGHSSVYAIPRTIALGERISRTSLIAQLQRTGYSEGPGSQMGHFVRTENGLEITTGPSSYYSPHTARLEFRNGKVSRIVSLPEGNLSLQYSMEPELVTNVFDESRQKRRPISYAELPPHLINAIVSVEDKRFFDHGGLDLIRIAKAAYVDLKERRKEQGASTLTMQLARSFWLDQEKTWGRKIAEVMLTLELERRLTKEQILELYVNEVYLGRRGSFSIHGLGEAARSYFAKDIRRLSIPEAAMLAGLIQRPAYFNPFRNPERMRDRRDLVLNLMRANGYLTDAQLAQARQAPLEVKPPETESTEAPYFVDVVNDELQAKFQDRNFASNSYRIYTTIDLALQRQAVDAVEAGMKRLDASLRRQRGKKGGPYPQVALVALDPHTG
ncbi:MAG: transglycosylase domain-containing protein, partial [Bryobacteraceae bacterium]